jgi:hypothetical protein
MGTTRLLLFFTVPASGVIRSPWMPSRFDNVAAA